MLWGQISIPSRKISKTFEFRWVGKSPWGTPEKVLLLVEKCPLVRLFATQFVVINFDTNDAS